MRWRIVTNEWNLGEAPWRGAIGIEEDDNSVEVPGLVCWFMRGVDSDVADRVVTAHNNDIAFISETVPSTKEVSVSAQDLRQAALDAGLDPERWNYLHTENGWLVRKGVVAVGIMYIKGAASDFVDMMNRRIAQ